MLFRKKHSKPCGGSKILRIRAPCGGGQAPALLYYNRHFPYQGNHPALPAGIRNYTVGNGLDRFEIFIQITGERSSPLRA